MTLFSMLYFMLLGWLVRKLKLDDAALGWIKVKYDSLIDYTLDRTQSQQRELTSAGKQ